MNNYKINKAIIIPIACVVLFFIESFTFYGLASLFNISSSHPLFVLLYFIIVGLTGAIMLWSIGSLMEKKYPAICKALHFFAIITYVMELLMAIFNFFII